MLAHSRSPCYVTCQRWVCRTWPTYIFKDWKSSLDDGKNPSYDAQNPEELRGCHCKFVPITKRGDEPGQRVEFDRNIASEHRTRGQDEQKTIGGASLAETSSEQQCSMRLASRLICSVACEKGFIKLWRFVVFGTHFSCSYRRQVVLTDGIIPVQDGKSKPDAFLIGGWRWRQHLHGTKLSTSTRQSRTGGFRSIVSIARMCPNVFQRHGERSGTRTCCQRDDWRVFSHRLSQQHMGLDSWLRQFPVLSSLRHMASLRVVITHLATEKSGTVITVHTHVSDASHLWTAVCTRFKREKTWPRTHHRTLKPVTRLTTPILRLRSLAQWSLSTRMWVTHCISGQPSALGSNERRHDPGHIIAHWSL